MPDLLQIGITIVSSFFAMSLLFRLFQVNYYNPLVQQIMAFTEPLLRLIRMVLPTIGRLDLASLLVLVLLYTLPVAWQSQSYEPIFLAWGLISAGLLLTNLLWFATILLVIMSWVAPSARHPAAELIVQLAAPLMAPFQRLMGGRLPLDISPIFVLIAISLVRSLLTSQGIELGMTAPGGDMR